MVAETKVHEIPTNVTRLEPQAVHTGARSLWMESFHFILYQRRFPVASLMDVPFVQKKLSYLAYAMPCFVPHLCCDILRYLARPSYTVDGRPVFLSMFLHALPFFMRIVQ